MREEVARLRDEGLSYGQIAKQLNISRDVVAGLLRRMGYPKSGFGVPKKLRPYKPRSPKPVKKETPAAVVSAPGKRKKLSRLCFLHHWY
jgi:hypothetical protein